MRHQILRSAAQAVDNSSGNDHESTGFRERLDANQVTVDAVPQVYALHRADDWFDDSDNIGGQTGVVAWVFALPDGQAYIVSTENGQRQICVSQSLERIGGFWAANFGADLVAVRTGG